MEASRREALKPFLEKADFMEQRIADGIERNRKGTGSLRLLLPDGKPLANASVRVKQKTHDFLYGANLFMLDEFDDRQKNEEYRRRFRDAFNQATLPFYWRDLEPEEGMPRYGLNSAHIYRRPTPELCLRFCEENGITPKEHCLFYDPYMPEWVPNDVASIKSALSKHFAELASNFANRIHGWEVINETLTRYYRRGNTTFYDDPEVIEWCFKEAEKFFPNNELIINEAHPFIWEFFHGNRSAYYMLIERALQKGARIDAIGLQYHMFHTLDRYNELSQIYYDPQRIFDVLDLYGSFGKPIQITEVTIPAYSQNADDEEIQREIVRNVYRMWFSHPTVEAITYWNLIDGFAAFAKPGDMTAGENFYYGGLLRYDFTPKPAYFAVKDLFEREFRTEEIIHTDGNGYASFRGFYGVYDIEVDGQEKTKHGTYHLAKNQISPKPMIL